VNFTSQETKLLERLRKQERQWHWARWLRLVAGICCIGFSVLFGFFLHFLIGIATSDHGLFSNANMVLFILLTWTQCCFYSVFGIWSLVTVVLDWHGNANRMLLLKLLDAQQKDS